MIKFEELKANWYISLLFCDVIHQVFLAVAKVLALQTSIDEVR